MADGETTLQVSISTFMIVAGTIGAGVVTTVAGPIPIGDGTTGATEATVGAGTDGIDGTTGVGVVTMVAGTTGVGEVTVIDMLGVLLTDIIPIMEAVIMHTTQVDEDITITIRLQVIVEELLLGVDLT